MISVGRNILVPTPQGGEARLTPARVIASSGMTITAQLDGATWPEVGARIDLFCHSRSGVFHQAAVRVDAITRLKPRPTLRFVFLNTPQECESRLCPRVTPQDPAIRVSLNGGPLLTVLDVGPEGFATLTAGEWKLGDRVRVALHAREQVFEGTAVVRSLQRRGIQMRVGLHAPGYDSDLRNGLDWIIWTSLKNGAGAPALAAGGSPAL